jgi:hypothetical protein
MRCVVCGKEVVAETAQYSDAWEASLRQHPCCSRECCGQFKPDVHWMPYAAPALLSDDEAAERMAFGTKRLRDGDGPGLVARDLLIAGVPSWMVRRALLGAAMAATKSDKLTRSWNAFGLAGGLLSGLGVFVRDRNRGVADASVVLSGNETVDAWEAHFGLPNSMA